MRLVGFVKYIIVVCCAFLLMGNSALSMSVVCDVIPEPRAVGDMASSGLVHRSASKDIKILEFHASEFKER